MPLERQIKEIEQSIRTHLPSFDFNRFNQVIDYYEDKNDIADRIDAVVRTTKDDEITKEFMDILEKYKDNNANKITLDVLCYFLNTKDNSLNNQLLELLKEFDDGNKVQIIADAAYDFSKGTRNKELFNEYFNLVRKHGKDIKMLNLIAQGIADIARDKKDNKAIKKILEIYNSKALNDVCDYYENKIYDDYGKDYYYRYIAKFIGEIFYHTRSSEMIDDVFDILKIYKDMHPVVGVVMAETIKDAVQKKRTRKTIKKIIDMYKSDRIIDFFQNQNTDEKINPLGYITGALGEIYEITKDESLVIGFMEFLEKIENKLLIGPICRGITLAGKKTNNKNIIKEMFSLYKCLKEEPKCMSISLGLENVFGSFKDGDKDAANIIKKCIKIINKYKEKPQILNVISDQIAGSLSLYKSRLLNFIDLYSDDKRILSWEKCFDMQTLSEINDVIIERGNDENNVLLKELYGLVEFYKDQKTILNEMINQFKKRIIDQLQKKSSEKDKSIERLIKIYKSKQLRNLINRYQEVEGFNKYNYELELLVQSFGDLTSIISDEDSFEKIFDLFKSNHKNITTIKKINNSIESFNRKYKDEKFTKGLIELFYDYKEDLNTLKNINNIIYNLTLHYKDDKLIKKIIKALEKGDMNNKTIECFSNSIKQISRIESDDDDDEKRKENKDKGIEEITKKMYKIYFSKEFLDLVDNYDLADIKVMMSLIDDQNSNDWLANQEEPIEKGFMTEKRIKSLLINYNSEFFRDFIKTFDEKIKELMITITYKNKISGRIKSTINSLLEIYKSDRFRKIIKDFDYEVVRCVAYHLDSAITRRKSLINKLFNVSELDIFRKLLGKRQTKDIKGNIASCVYATLYASNREKDALEIINLLNKFEKKDEIKNMSDGIYQMNVFLEDKSLTRNIINLADNFDNSYAAHIFSRVGNIVGRSSDKDMGKRLFSLLDEKKNTQDICKTICSELNSIFVEFENYDVSDICSTLVEIYRIISPKNSMPNVYQEFSSFVIENINDKDKIDKLACLVGSEREFLKKQDGSILYPLCLVMSEINKKYFTTIKNLGEYDKLNLTRAYKIVQNYDDKEPGTLNTFYKTFQAALETRPESVGKWLLRIVKGYKKKIDDGVLETIYNIQEAKEQSK